MSHPADMRLHENREILTNIEHHHLNIDGTPDLRYKENQQKSSVNDIGDPSELFEIPTKKDGTADLRYAESKEAEALGVISSDEVIEGHEHHMKKDGSRDLRFKENHTDRTGRSVSIE